jgi:beta-mannanase
VGGLDAYSTATKVDLGPDPGIPAPTLETPPDDLFKPIKDLLQPWLSWQVPAHSATCPTWQAAPSISGHVFNIDLSYHCTFAEQYRSAITAAAIACWVVIAALIILSA